MNVSGQVLLSHLYPDWDGIDIISEAKSLCSCITLEARDGLDIKV